MSGVIDFLDPYAPAILITKGALAILGVLLLIYHMNHEWSHMAHPDQRARYLLLLGYGVLQAGATPEQLEEGIGISYRHLGGLATSIALVVVAVMSIRSYRHRASDPSNQGRRSTDRRSN